MSEGFDVEMAALVAIGEKVQAEAMMKEDSLRRYPDYLQLDIVRFINFQKTRPDLRGAPPPIPDYEGDAIDAPHSPRDWPSTVERMRMSALRIWRLRKDDLIGRLSSGELIGGGTLHRLLPDGPLELFPVPPLWFRHADLFCFPSCAINGSERLDDLRIFGPDVGQHDSGVIYQTGLPGRRSSWQLIATEVIRRHGAGETELFGNNTKLARSLITWLAVTHPHAARPKLKTVRNKLPGLLRSLTAPEIK